MWIYGVLNSYVPSQAVRLTYGYAEYAIHPCYNRKTWQDIDDLVFEVNHDAFMYPSTQPSSSIEPTDILIPASSSSSPTERNSSCDIKKIKIQSTTNLAINMFDFRAFSNTSNVALRGIANQSTTFNDDDARFGASNAVDNDTATFSSTIDGPGQWWQVILETSADIHSIQILNRYCGQDPSDRLGCLCRLANAEIILYNDDMSSITTRILGNTCGMILIAEIFACPNTLAPVEPTAHQTVSPSPSLSMGPSILSNLSMSPVSQNPSFQPVDSVTKQSTHSPAHIVESTFCNVKTVRIQSTTTLPINMFEFEALSDGIDFAELGTASQSTTFNNDELKFGAANALDGNQASFSSTLEGNREWWQVIFDSAIPIQRIQIFNRYCGQDTSDPLGCLCRLSYSEILLYNETGGLIATKILGNTCELQLLVVDYLPLCSISSTPTEPNVQQTNSPSGLSSINPSYTLPATVSPISKGNTSLTAHPSSSPLDTIMSGSSCGVKRIKIQSTTIQPIHVFEIKIISQGVNVAVEGNAIQSTTFKDDAEKFGANNSVDGDEATFSSTAEQSGQWWQVQLQKSVDIDLIEIMNRYCGPDPTDPLGCLCRLSDVELVLYDEDGDVLVTRAFGNTCGVLSIEENFSCSRTRVPSLSPSLFTVSPISMADTGRPSPNLFAATSQPTSSPITKLLIAAYDSTLKAPKCAQVSAGCSSGSLLIGSGSFSSPYLESNAPNTVDGCEGDNATRTNFSGSVYQQDECIDVIVLTSVDDNFLQVGHEVNVNVSVWSAQSVSDRTDPHKSSIAHIYYALDIQNITWKHIHSEIVEPSQGEHTFAVNFALESDFSISPDSSSLTILQAVRVSYSYAQYYSSDPCPENQGYTDVDDLIFAVSLLPTTTTPTKSPASSAYCHVQGAWDTFFLLCFFQLLVLCTIL